VGDALTAVPQELILEFMDATDFSRSMGSSVRRVMLRLVLVTALVVATAGVGSAQSTQAGGSVVVEEGETVGDLQAAGGQVLIRGTVDGDLRGYAGTVVVSETGVVTGDFQASAGSVTVHGTVQGDVESAAGSVIVGPNGVVGEDVTAAASDLVVEGTVEGDVTAAVERLQLAPTASIAGSVQYSADAEFDREEGASVGGAVSAVDNLSVDAGFGDFAEGGPIGLLLSAYGVIATLVIGAALLVVSPEFTDTVVAEVREETLRSGGIGLGGLVGIPIVLLLVAVTIVGLPLALLGLMAFGLLVFVSAALAEYAAGTWALSYTSIDSQWAALAVGVVGVALLARIPVVGVWINLLVFLFGFGAVLAILYRGYRRRRAGAGDVDGRVSGSARTGSAADGPGRL
jgi:cytoskeletal protein CcmA (bactofilin family)